MRWKICRSRATPLAAAHLRHLNPWPRNLGEVLRRFRKVLVPEMNSGQLRMLLRAEFLVDAVGFSKIKGKPFQTREIEQKISQLLKDEATSLAS